MAAKNNTLRELFSTRFCNLIKKKKGLSIKE